VFCDKTLLRLVNPEKLVNQDVTRTLADALVELISRGAFDGFNRSEQFQNLSYSRLGYSGDRETATVVLRELESRGLAQRPVDGVSVPTHPAVRLAVTAAVRDSPAAVGLVLGVLYLFPILVHIVTNAGWQRHLQQIAPMNAGLAIRNTTGLRNLPLSPWSGLGVLTIWAAVALLIGGLVLQIRDA
jgi:hypothetical protein